LYGFKGKYTSNIYYIASGPPREILQGGTRLFWGLGSRLYAGPMRGRFSRYMVRSPESHEGVCESLKAPISLTIDVLF
jgi:hypothetical protein